MQTFYIQIMPSAVFTKTEEFFKNQGGLKEQWGKSWRKIEAKDINDARQKAKDIGVKEGVFSKDRADRMI